MNEERRNLGVTDRRSSAVRTYLVTSGEIMHPYCYVVVCNRMVSRFRLTQAEARNELFKGVAIPSPLVEFQLTNRKVG